MPYPTLPANPSRKQLVAHRALFPKQFEDIELPGLGWIKITEIGSENFYFLYDGDKEGYCKALG